MAVDTYYFDASDAAATDPDAAWTDDANAFDSDATPTTYAINSRINGSTSSNYLMGEGTDAPTTGNPISQVRARVYRGASGPGAGNLNGAIYTDGLGELLGTPSADSSANPNWGAYVTLSTPTGEWTWSKVAALEIKFYATSNGGVTFLRAYKAEVEVTSELLSTITGISSVTGLSTITF